MFYIHDLFLNWNPAGRIHQRSTDQYCDILLAQWRNEINATIPSSYDCEGCRLGGMKLQLEAPNKGLDVKFEMRRMSMHGVKTPH